MPKSMDAAATSLGTRFVGIPQLDADVAPVILLVLGCTFARHVAVDQRAQARLAHLGQGDLQPFDDAVRAEAVARVERLPFSVDGAPGGGGLGAAEHGTHAVLHFALVPAARLLGQGVELAAQHRGRRELGHGDAGEEQPRIALAGRQHTELACHLPVLQRRCAAGLPLLEGASPWQVDPVRCRSGDCRGWPQGSSRGFPQSCG